MRFATNSYIASCLNLLKNKVIQEQNTHHVIIDEGAKYNKNAQTLSRLLAGVNNWSYQPIRNDVTQYDKSYHVCNESTYQGKLARNPRLRPIIKRYIEWSSAPYRVVAGETYHVLTFDCLQYYVKPCELHQYYREADPTFYVVGLNYLPFPGTYPYVAGNGRVTVGGSPQGLARVTVYTNGGGSYSHNLSIFRQRTQSLRLGFTTAYFHVAKRMWELYTFVPLPSCSYSGYSLLVNRARQRKLQYVGSLRPFTKDMFEHIMSTFVSNREKNTVQRFLAWFRFLMVYPEQLTIYARPKVGFLRRSLKCYSSVVLEFNLLKPKSCLRQMCRKLVGCRTIHLDMNDVGRG